MGNGQRSECIELDIVFDAIVDPIFILDKNSIIIKANKAFLDLTGASQSDIIGRKCHEVVHKLGKPWPGCPVEEAKKDKRAHMGEVNDPNLGLSLLVTASPILDEKGEFAGVVHIAKDITGRKQLEGDLRESENKYKTLYESSADAIMMVIPGKGFIDCNTATLKMFTCKNMEEFISYSPSDLSPDHQPDGQSSSKKAQEMMAIAMEKGSNFFEWKHKRTTGEEFFATVLLTKMKLKDRDVLQATVRDIAEQKKAEEDLRKKILDLERFQKVTVDRELRMKELKARIAELEGKLGERR